MHTHNIYTCRKKGREKATTFFSLSFPFFLSSEKRRCGERRWPLVRPFPDSWRSRGVDEEGAFPPRDIARCTNACTNVAARV